MFLSFFFFRSLRAVICVRAAHGGGEPLLTGSAAKEPASETRRREMAGRGTARGRVCPRRQQGPRLPPHCPSAAGRSSRQRWYWTPQRGRLKKMLVWALPCSSEPCPPCQLNIEAFHVPTQLRRVTASWLFNLSRGRRITRIPGQVFSHLPANSWGQ